MVLWPILWVFFLGDWLWTRFMDITDCPGVLSLWVMGHTRRWVGHDSANQLPTTCKGIGMHGNVRRQQDTWYNWGMHGNVRRQQDTWYHWGAIYCLIACCHVSKTLPRIGYGSKPDSFGVFLQNCQWKGSSYSEKRKKKNFTVVLDGFEKWKFLFKSMPAKKTKGQKQQQQNNNNNKKNKSTTTTTRVLWHNQSL